MNKVSFFHQCSKMQIIPIKKLNIKTCFIQFLWFFRLKCWFKGQIISRTHLSLPNACKLMCFDRNINGNRDVKFLIGIIGNWTDQRNLLYEQEWEFLLGFWFGKNLYTLTWFLDSWCTQPFVILPKATNVNHLLIIYWLMIHFP